MGNLKTSPAVRHFAMSINPGDLDKLLRPLSVRYIFLFLRMSPNYFFFFSRLGHTNSGYVHTF